MPPSDAKTRGVRSRKAKKPDNSRSVHIRQGRSRRLTFACRQRAGADGHPARAAKVRAVVANREERACEHAYRAEEAALDQAVRGRPVEFCPEQRLVLNCRTVSYTDRQPMTLATRFIPNG